MIKNNITADVTAYTILLTIWAKSDVKGKEKKVYQIYLR